MSCSFPTRFFPHPHNKMFFSIFQRAEGRKKSNQVEIIPPPPYTNISASIPVVGQDAASKNDNVEIIRRTPPRNYAHRGTQTDANTPDHSMTLGYQVVRTAAVERTSLNLSPAEIQASDIPQWLWSNSHCRAWLIQVF